VIKSIIPGLQHTVIRRERCDIPVLNGSVHAVDHIALVVEHEQAETIAQWYKNQFGLIRLDDVTVKTDFNGLLLKILRSEQAEFYIVFASSLSAPGQFDQVKEFLSKNGPGLQHVAFKCDIMKHVKQLHNFVQFIKPPSGYYQKPHVKLLMNTFDPMQRDAIVTEGILIDHDELDENKILMQVFTRPVAETGMFFELIERINQSASFGRQNVKALFEGIEEQRKLKSVKDV